MVHLGLSKNQISGTLPSSWGDFTQASHASDLKVKQSARSAIAWMNRLLLSCKLVDDFTYVSVLPNKVVAVAAVHSGCRAESIIGDVTRGME